MDIKRKITNRIINVDKQINIKKIDDEHTRNLCVYNDSYHTVFLSLDDKVSSSHWTVKIERGGYFEQADVSYSFSMMARKQHKRDYKKRPVQADERIMITEIIKKTN